MVKKRQPIVENVAEPLAHENEEQQRGDDTLAVEERPDDAAKNVARRRASLDKEIRAGWQRALRQ